MLDLNAIFKIKSDTFVARKIENELILIPLVNSVADMTGVLTLNIVATSIFEAINGKATIKDIMKIILEEYDVAKEDLEKDLVYFLNQAQERNIIEKVEY